MKKFKNTYGQAYAADSTPSENKLLFRAALLTAGKKDGVNYMKRFQDTWQYVPALGSIPFAIAQAAREHLIDSDFTDSSRLQTLKMA